MSFCSFSKGEVYKNHFESGRFVDIELLNTLAHIMFCFTEICHNAYIGIKYLSKFLSGKYVCNECGHDLFKSETKYEHHTPWPAFSKTIHPDSVAKVQERTGALKVNIA